MGVRNIAGFNAEVKEFNAQSEYKRDPLPLIVVIVGWVGDLMMVASKEVEDISFVSDRRPCVQVSTWILTTQRPSVDVISGLIKANVPSRVAFAVSSGQTLVRFWMKMEQENCLVEGDMLFPNRLMKIISSSPRLLYLR